MAESTETMEVAKSNLAACSFDGAKSDHQDQLSSSKEICFECSICLEFAVEPVVTLCGHLYCWTCIYKWIVQAGSNGGSTDCPVCKAPISQNTLVPIYGRGLRRRRSITIPDMPSHVTTSAVDVRPPNMTLQQQQQQHYNYPNEYGGMPYSSPMTTTSVLSSTVGRLLYGMGDAVLPRLLGNQWERSIGPFMSSSSRPGRRQELQVEFFLRQVWVFLCCCALLFLLS